MRKLNIHELNRLSVEEFKTTKKNSVLVILDNIRSANNVGSFFRTGDAFSIEAIYLCGITAQPPHRDIQKTAIGATESVNWKHFADAKAAVLAAKNNGYKIFAIEQCEGSLSLEKFSPTAEDKIAFIFGNEVSGVDQDLIDISDGCLEIPQWGTKHSLNVSVTGGIILWDYIAKTTTCP